MDSRHAEDTQAGRVPAADIEQAVLALTQRVLEDRDLIVLGGPARSGRSTVLGELERRLPPQIHPLQVSTRSARVEDLLAQILDRLQLPTSGDPQEMLRGYVERRHAEGIRSVLIVNDSYRLSNKKVSRLLSLAGDGAARMPVVLATSRYESCLRALGRSGACVSLVQLGGSASAPPPRDDEPEVAASGPPAPRAPSTPTPLPGPNAGSEVESPWSEPLRSVEELLADLDPRHPSPASAEPVPAAPLPVRSSALDSIPVRAPGPAPARVASDHRPPARHAPPPARRPPAQRSWSWPGIASAGIVAGLCLAFGFLSVDGGIEEGRPIAANDTGDSPSTMARAPEALPVGVRAGDLPAARGGMGGSGLDGDDLADTHTVVLDVRQAITLLEKSDDARAHAAAKQFLAEHGPDPVGYERLDELDRRRAATSSEVVQIVTARSRVRSALCAAWADEPLGEAAARLGCPGVVPRPAVP